MSTSKEVLQMVDFNTWVSRMNDLVNVVNAASEKMRLINAQLKLLDPWTQEVAVLKFERRVLEAIISRANVILDNQNVVSDGMRRKK